MTQFRCLWDNVEFVFWRIKNASVQVFRWHLKVAKSSGLNADVDADLESLGIVCPDPQGFKFLVDPTDCTRCVKIIFFSNLSLHSFLSANVFVNFRIQKSSNVHSNQG